MRFFERPSSWVHAHRITSRDRNYCDTHRLAVASRATSSRSRTQCKNNLKQIGLALHNYHDVHLTFPAGGITGEGDNAATERKKVEYPLVPTRSGLFHL